MTEVFSWLVHMFGIMNVTMWAIPFFSTIPERVPLFFLCSIALGASFFFTRLLRSSLLQFLLPVLTSFVLFTGLYVAFPFHEYPGRFPIDQYLFPGNQPVAVTLSLALIVAIDRSRLWLRGDNEGAKKTAPRITEWLPTVVTVSALAALLLNGWSLRRLARTLHADQAVQQFAIGDFNGLELDAEQGLLFASGHGTDYLLAYDVNALDQTPRRSQVEINGAQAFAYNPGDRELYILNLETETLLFLDATTLALKKVVPGLRVSPGDAWITWDRHTGHIIIASEEQEDGYPTVVIDRMAGKVLYTMELRLLNAFLHPRKPLFYMGFHEKLLAYDTKLRTFVRTFDPGRNRFLERMDMTPDQHELLVAAPMNSAVLRFDAETLELKGSIGTVFGVRTLAVDPMRNILLTGSLISNMLEVIDLETKTRVAKYYVGPWLRTIVPDTARGAAYVSSIEGLFRVDYTTSKSN
jgi:DNA-binding beta-propeller fold protein YncE